MWLTQITTGCAIIVDICIFIIMKIYKPWQSISVMWQRANQLWSEAWYEEIPTPPTPSGQDDANFSGALDQKSQSVWANWIENQKRKKYKRKIELACVVGGVEFKQEKECTEETIVGFKVNGVSLTTDFEKNTDVKLNEVNIYINR